MSACRRPAGGCLVPGCAQNGMRNSGALRAFHISVLNEQSCRSCLSSSPHQQSLHTPLCQNALFPTGIPHLPTEEDALLQHVSRELKGSGCIREWGFIASRSTCGIDLGEATEIPIAAWASFIPPFPFKKVSLICLSSGHDKCLLQLPIPLPVQAVHHAKPCKRRESKSDS